jgi:hypothetical protein
MKNNFFKVCLSLALCIAVVSCKKDGPGENPTTPGNARTVRFVLYTDQDFSDDNAIIHFSIFIKKGSTYVFDPTGNFLFDSAYAPMQIKDIPDPAHKIVVEKKVVGYDDSVLTAGFVYEIEDVGTSWHIDTSRAGNLLKVIDYNFR